MVWTKEEKELISVLDDFVSRCARSKEMRDVNCYLLLYKILSSTKGEVTATKKYCQKILNAEKIEPEQQDSFVTVNHQVIEEPAISTNKYSDNIKKTKTKTYSKVKSFWATLFVIFSLFVIFFSAKRSPNLSSNESFSNVATFCPEDLIEKAETGIINQDKLILEKAIASLQELRQQQANQLGVECQQILWETQYIYAINFLASEGQRKPAVEVLCSIPPQYYKDKSIVPWFTRWSNTNSTFGVWLQQYQATNECSAAVYLK